MGLFERRCMITGVATRFVSSAAVVPLLEVDGEYRPVALPIWGTYDGYGSLEAIELGPNAKWFQSAFVRLLAAEDIRVDWRRLLEEPLVPATVMELLLEPYEVPSPDADVEELARQTEAHLRPLFARRRARISGPRVILRIAREDRRLRREARSATRAGRPPA
jgi:hypothetical protein